MGLLLPALSRNLHQTLHQTPRCAKKTAFGIELHRLQPAMLRCTRCKMELQRLRHSLVNFLIWPPFLTYHWCTSPFWSCLLATNQSPAQPYGHL